MISKNTSVSIDERQTTTPTKTTPSRSSRNKRRKSKHWFWLAGLAVIAAIIWFALQYQNADSENANILTQPVTRGNIENAITAVGTLNALRSVNVGAQVSGQLKSVKVEVGDKVGDNQLIAEIDPSSFEKKVDMSNAQLDNLKAQLISREAQLTLKKLSFERQKSLLSSRGVSQATVDQAEADLAVAQADVKALTAQIRMQESQLEGDKVDLGFTNIYSPMAGTVVDQAAKEGETLNANQTTPTIVTVADLSIMTVEAQVSEADISRLKPDMAVYFTLLGQPGKRYTSQLRQIKPTPETTNNVVLYNALFDVPNPDGELMINMSTQVYFVLEAADDVLLVPTAALHPAKTSEKSGKSAVTVVTASGEKQEKIVETGIRNRVQVEIKAGLAEGDMVVVSSQSSADREARSRNNMRMRGIF